MGLGSQLGNTMRRSWEAGPSIPATVVGGWQLLLPRAFRPHDLLPKAPDNAMKAVDLSLPYRFRLHGIAHRLRRPRFSRRDGGY
jgi:hypothetical protein